jgi:NADH-quinone oxidoreductase subunit G
VLRVVPLENEAVNECWLADRDRFSYEGLNAEDRLTQPMLKQGSEWKAVDWQTALEYVANGLRQIGTDHGAASIGALVSPHSTLEELSLATKLMRGLGSDNIDHRLRNADFTTAENGAVRWLGMSIASLSSLQQALVIGSNLRKDHPLFALRIREAVRNGGEVHAVAATREDWAMPIANALIADPATWTRALSDIADAVDAAVDPQRQAGQDAETPATAIAAALLSGERKAILLGNAAAHHAQASVLLALAQRIAARTGATVGYLTEAANTVGAQWVGAQPQAGGLNAAQMIDGGLKAVLLLNTEPESDSAAGAQAVAGLNRAQMVVTLSPFKTNLAFSDVLLPIAPFTETPGTFVNAEGRIQSFHAVVKPLGDTRPAWKVLRVLGNMLGLSGFEFESAQDVLAELRGDAGADTTHVPSARLSNATGAVAQAAELPAGTPMPAVAAIYQLDGIVRRAPSLQMTADGRGTTKALLQVADAMLSSTAIPPAMTVAAGVQA